MGVGNERISFRVLPATKAICIYHKGAYDRLGEAYAYIYRYAMENGYQVAGFYPSKGRSICVHISVRTLAVLSKVLGNIFSACVDQNSTFSNK